MTQKLTLITHYDLLSGPSTPLASELAALFVICIWTDHKYFSFFSVQWPFLNRKLCFNRGCISNIQIK